VSSRAAIASFALTTLLALGGLALFASADRRPSASSLGVPDEQTLVPLLRQGQTACQGPFGVQVEFSTVRLWIAPSRPARISVEVVDPRGLTPAARGSASATQSQVVSRRVPVGTFPPELRAATVTVPLTRRIPSGRRVVVCIRDESGAPVAVAGGPAPGSAGRLLIDRTPVASSGLALVFIRAHAPTLMSMLPTVFRRAALFKANWVGAWTFWALLAAVLAAFAVAGAAVATAARTDDRQAERDLNTLSSERTVAQ